MIDPEYDRVGGTFSARDIGDLARAVLDTAPFAQLAAAERVDRASAVLSVTLPPAPFDPQSIVELVSRWPFRIGLMPSLIGHPWHDVGPTEYFCPAISADHALLGWCALAKGAGHEERIVSRRWIEHGPWRVVRGPQDTTFIQFHDLHVDAATSLAQAAPAHDWFVRGFMRPDHRFTRDIEGIYTAEDRLLRILVADRHVSEAEMLDACVARRDGKHDPQRPIDNIAYIFMEEDAALAHLDALWLHGLECRTIRYGQEIRLDQHHTMPRASGWW